MIRSWSKTQGGVTLSSAEAELAGLVKTTGEVLGLAGVMRDLGGDCAEKAIVYADASAALGIAERRGVGSVRHLDTRRALGPGATNQRVGGVSKGGWLVEPGGYGD